MIWTSRSYCAPERPCRKRRHGCVLRGRERINIHTPAFSAGASALCGGCRSKCIMWGVQKQAHYVGGNTERETLEHAHTSKVLLLLFLLLFLLLLLLLYYHHHTTPSFCRSKCSLLGATRTPPTLKSSAAKRASNEHGMCLSVSVCVYGCLSEGSQ
jgi:hypothetical protein